MMSEGTKYQRKHFNILSISIDFLGIENVALSRHVTERNGVHIGLFS